MDKFNLYRQQYKTLVFEKYDVIDTEEEIKITYYFNIEGLQVFTPEIRIPKKDIFVIKTINEQADNIIFNIGMIELISYWKCVCPPNIIVKCGALLKEQIQWFKKVYYHGLGEFFFINNIDISYDEFVNINCDNSDNITYTSNEEDYVGNMIPIGGGKDSVVSLEILKKQPHNYGFIINPKKDALDCAKTAGYDDKQIFEVYRTLDQNIVRLNKEGYLNGHTPFSALVAFISYLGAYLTKSKYIVLSNEASANEATVVGTDVNHQYSKSYAFEKDFYDYTQLFLDKNIKYFSLLRPLNELQIAMIFAKYDQYHSSFKSCNLGSKNANWNWCCECAKCLFIFTILSPFLYKEKLINIFGKDLFESKEYLNTFKELLGFSNNKPFDCVGTYEEANYAVKKTIDMLEEKNEALPYLLSFYKEHYSKTPINKELLSTFNSEHNVPKEYYQLLVEEVNKCIQE